MHKVEETGKSYVSTDQAIHAIAKHSEQSLSDLTEKDTSNSKLAKVTDVSDSLLNVPASSLALPHPPQSSIDIYKGIVSSLIEWSNKCVSNCHCGIMAGHEQSITDVIICPNMIDAVQNEEVKKRWETQKVSVMGFVLWLPEQKSHPVSHYIPSLLSLKSPFETLALLFIRDHGQLEFWQITRSKSAEPAAYTRCELKVSSHRKKDVKYMVLHLDSVGVSILGGVENHVSAILSKTIADRVQRSCQEQTKKGQNIDSQKQCWFQKCDVPADGLCFFHSILGSMDESWSQIPRENGWAINKRIRKKEEDMAKGLRGVALSGMGRSGHDHSERLDGILRGHVDLDDVDLLAKALGLAVRCTIPKEVGHAYTHVYI